MAGGCMMSCHCIPMIRFYAAGAMEADGHDERGGQLTTCGEAAADCERHMQGNRCLALDWLCLLPLAASS